MSSILPVQVLVEPVIDNWIDDSDPHYDFVKGHHIKHKDVEGWHELYYGSRSDVAAWLAQRGYEQVSCTMRRHKHAGKYEHIEVR